MTEVGAPDNKYHLILLPDTVALKPRTNHSDCLGQIVEIHSTYNSKCHLLEDAGYHVRLTNEK